MANVVLRPTDGEMAALGPQYREVAKSFSQGAHYVGVQASDVRPAEISDRGNAALVVHFLDPVETPLLNALVQEITRRLRRRGDGRREAVLCGPDGKVFRRIPLNS